MTGITDSVTDIDDIAAWDVNSIVLAHGGWDMAVKASSPPFAWHHSHSFDAGSAIKLSSKHMFFHKAAGACSIPPASQKWSRALCSTHWIDRLQAGAQHHSS